MERPRLEFTRHVHVDVAFATVEIGKIGRHCDGEVKARQTHVKSERQLTVVINDGDAGDVGISERCVPRARLEQDVEVGVSIVVVIFDDGHSDRLLRFVLLEHLAKNKQRGIQGTGDQAGKHKLVQANSRQSSVPTTPTEVGRKYGPNPDLSEQVSSGKS